MRQMKFDPQKVAVTLAIGAMAFVVVGLPLVGQQSAEGVTGDAVRGKTLFEKRCTGCHSLEQDKEGPRLRDVYGRRAGTVAGFPYSDALKGAQFTWDAATLDKWLTDTESVVPNNDMSFHVPKASERADIIRFLQISSGR